MSNELADVAVTASLSICCDLETARENCPSYDRSCGLGVAAGGVAGFPSATCPTGLETMTGAQLFLSRNIPGGGEVGDEDWQHFLDEEVTPRFPDGLAVVIRGDEAKLAAIHAA
jgi:hypothetical protein